MLLSWHNITDLKKSSNKDWNRISSSETANMVYNQKVTCCRTTASIRCHCTGFIYTEFVMVRIDDQGGNKLFQKVYMWKIILLWRIKLTKEFIQIWPVKDLRLLIHTLTYNMLLSQKIKDITLIINKMCNCSFHLIESLVLTFSLNRHFCGFCCLSS